jgi:hypothetical protein
MFEENSVQDSTLLTGDAEVCHTIQYLQKVPIYHSGFQFFLCHTAQPLGLGRAESRCGECVGLGVQ